MARGRIEDMRRVVALAVLCAATGAAPAAADPVMVFIVAGQSNTVG